MIPEKREFGIEQPQNRKQPVPNSQTLKQNVYKNSSGAQQPRDYLQATSKIKAIWAPQKSKSRQVSQDRNQRSQSRIRQGAYGQSVTTVLEESSFVSQSLSNINDISQVSNSINLSLKSKNSRSSGLKTKLNKKNSSKSTYQTRKENLVGSCALTQTFKRRG